MGHVGLVLECGSSDGSFGRSDDDDDGMTVLST